MFNLFSTAVVLLKKSSKNQVYNPTNSHKAIHVNPKNLRYLRAKKTAKAI
jgi:hypothetical protein